LDKELNKNNNKTKKNMERRVVITGMGIYSCLGKTLEEVRGLPFTTVSQELYLTQPVKRWDFVLL
jgi:3-oxoacyl-(acyl-carrier-protein) synthase